MLFKIVLIVWLKKASTVSMGIKNILTKNVIAKKDNKDFENSTKYWICVNHYTDGD